MLQNWAIINFIPLDNGNCVKTKCSSLSQEVMLGCSELAKMHYFSKDMRNKLHMLINKTVGFKKSVKADARADMLS